MFEQIPSFQTVCFQGPSFPRKRESSLKKDFFTDDYLVGREKPCYFNMCLTFRQPIPKGCHSRHKLESLRLKDFFTSHYSIIFGNCPFLYNGNCLAHLTSILLEKANIHSHFGCKSFCQNPPHSHGLWFFEQFFSLKSLFCF